MASSAAARARRVPSSRSTGWLWSRRSRPNERVGPAVPGHVPCRRRGWTAPRWPARRPAACERQRAVDHRAQLGGVPGAAQEVEVERGVQLVRAQVAGEPLRCRAARPRRSVPGRGIRRRPCARPGRSRARRRGRCTGDGVRRTSGSAGSLTSSAAESIRTPSTPRSNQNRRMSSNSCAHLRVGPVEVRLLGREQVQVPLARRAVRVGRPGPGGAAEDRRPVVRRQLAVGTAPGPEPEQFALGRARPRRERGLEPRGAGRSSGSAPRR